ncbi:MAG: hypothetical protein R2881_03170 [Eubacteriales bacterium]
MKIRDAAEAMTAYNAGDARQINHMIEGVRLCQTIGEREGLDARTQEVLLERSRR